MTTAAVIGATGLVGRAIVRELLRDARYQQINLIVRRQPINLANDQRIKLIITDFSDTQWHHALNVDQVYCALGTTIKIAGSQAAFRAIDFDLVCHAALAAKQQQCQHFLVISALGANADSSIFYNRVKGEMENKLLQLDLPRLNLFRPSLLTGPRAEFRPLEKLMNLFAWLAPLRWRPVANSSVALAMLRVANTDDTTMPTVIESDTIQRLAQTAQQERKESR